MPVDRISVIEIFIAQQAKPMAADLIRLAQDLRRFVGKMLAQQFRALGTLTGRKKTATRKTATKEESSDWGAEPAFSGIAPVRTPKRWRSKSLCLWSSCPRRTCTSSQFIRDMRANLLCHPEATMPLSYMPKWSALGQLLLWLRWILPSQTRPLSPALRLTGVAINGLRFLVGSPEEQGFGGFGGC